MKNSTNVYVCIFSTWNLHFGLRGRTCKTGSPSLSVALFFPCFNCLHRQATRPNAEAQEPTPATWLRPCGLRPWRLQRQHAGPRQGRLTGARISLFRGPCASAAILTREFEKCAKSQDCVCALMRPMSRHVTAVRSLPVISSGT